MTQEEVILLTVDTLVRLVTIELIKAIVWVPVLLLVLKISDRRF